MSVDVKLAETTPANVVGTPPRHPPMQRSLSGDDGRRRRTSSTYGTFTRVVVVAVDASDHAKKAFDWYLANVWRSDDLIVLVNCPEVPHFPVFRFKSGFNLPVEEWKKIMDDVNSGARILEEEYQSYCTVKKLKHKVRSETMKNVGEGILRMAQEENADLIVCGSKGTGSTIFNKGSVAECIGRNSTISTLIVPAKAIVC